MAEDQVGSSLSCHDDHHTDEKKTYTFMLWLDKKIRIIYLKSTCISCRTTKKHESWTVDTCTEKDKIADRLPIGSRCRSFAKICTSKKPYRSGSRHSTKIFKRIQPIEKNLYNNWWHLCLANQTDSDVPEDRRKKLMELKKERKFSQFFEEFCLLKLIESPIDKK